MAKYLMMMNFNVNRAMKKIYAMIFVAAATLAGCQNYNDSLENNSSKIKVTANVDVAEVSRTALVQNDGVYSATWKAGDAIALIELADENIAIAESAPLAADVMSAAFTFNLDVATAESYTYIAASPRSAVDMQATNKVIFTLPANQAPATMDTFDGAADLLISQAVEMDHQPTEPIAFSTIKRLSAVGKMTVKNLRLAEGEVVEKVTFACGHDLAGLARVKVNDLAEENIDIEYKNCTNAVNVTLPTAQSGDFTTYFSCYPATLAAGDVYTITVKTSTSTYVKNAEVASNLVFKSGNITTFSVNMADVPTASVTTVEKFKDNACYAIAFKDKNGKLYLMQNTECERRPASTLIGSLGLSISANGSLIGSVPSDYCWNITTRTDENGVVYGQFKYEDRYLITTYYAQGIGVSKQYAEDPEGNGDGYNGNDSKVYTNEILIAPNGDGYRLYVAKQDSSDLNLCVYGGSQFRLLDASSNADLQGTVYFFQVNNSVVSKSLYPVVTKAAHVTEGTYVIMHNISGSMYALKNTAKAASADAVHSANVSLTFDEKGNVTAAEIGEDYKWVLIQNEDGSWLMRSWTEKSYVWHRDNSTGVAIAAESPSGNHVNSWIFSDHTTGGLQMCGVGHTRYARTNQGADGAMGTWGTLAGPTGSIVLVRISNSVDFK